jgi:hypothetical protein
LGIATRESVTGVAAFCGEERNGRLVHVEERALGGD